MKAKAKVKDNNKCTYNKNTTKEDAKKRQWCLFCKNDKCLGGQKNV